MKIRYLLLAVASLFLGCAGATTSVSSSSSSSDGVSYPSTPSLTTKYTTATTTAAGTSNASYWGALNCHDPQIFQDDDGTFYTFSTDASIGNTWANGIQIRKSTDLMKWTCLKTPAFTTIPQDLIDWCYTNRTSSGETVVDSTPIWAPCVIKFNDKYYMYYGVNADVTALNTSGTQYTKAHAYIGVATADTVTGPYTQLARIVRSTTLTNDATLVDGDSYYCGNTYYGAIDPSIVWDADGNMWMNYGSWRNGIAMLRLDNSTGLPLEDPDQAYSETSSRTSYGTKVAGGGSASYEGAQVFYPGGDWYYILISSGDLNTDYSMRLGRRAVSDGIAGAYVDADDYDLTGVTYTWGDTDNSHSHGTKFLGSHKFASELGFRAPGGMSVLKLSDGRWIVAGHTRTAFLASYYFYLQVRQFWINDDGWPVANPCEYADESLESLSTAQVAGTYDGIRSLRTNTSASWSTYEGTSYSAVNVADAEETDSSTIVLGSNGKISGDTWSGTWSVSGTGNLTMNLKSSSGSTLGTYTGYVVPSWDWSREKLAKSVSRTTLALTLLGSDGETFQAVKHNY